MEKWQKARAERRGYSRGVGRNENHHAIRAYGEISSHHARGACEVSHRSDYCENMFELFLTNTANLDTLRNFWNPGARFARCMGIRQGGQRIFSEWQKARERAGGGSMMSTSFKIKFCEPTGNNFKAIKSITFLFSI